MIELRWKLDTEHPEEYKENSPLDAYTLQYRQSPRPYEHNGWHYPEWSEWKDVPFVSEDK